MRVTYRQNMGVSKQENMIDGNVSGMARTGSLSDISGVVVKLALESTSMGTQVLEP